MPAHLVVLSGLPPKAIVLPEGSIVAGRVYTVKSKPNLLNATWDPVTVSPPTDNGPQRTVTDTAATGARKFYHIEITKP